MNSNVWTIETENVEETRALGAKLASFLQGGDALALMGDLGTGKTAFTQGLGRALGITEPITSPTFTLVNQYRTANNRLLQHVDSYRLSNAPAEMWDIGLTDLFNEDNIVVIEWADRIPGLLPDAYLEIVFEYLDENRRRLVFVAHGLRYAILLEQLAQIA